MMHSLRWRLVGWYMLLLSGVLLLFSAGIYVAVRKLLVDNFDDVLSQQASVIAETIDMRVGRLAVTDDVWLGGLRDSEHFTRIYHADGSLLLDNNSADEEAPELPSAVNLALQGQRNVTQVNVHEGPMRIATFPIVYNGQVAGVLQVGVSLEDIQETLRKLLKVLLVLAPTTLLLASGGGLFLANRALAPIDRITRTAQRISAENLSGRIGLRGLDDEVGRLAHTFDAMLGRLEAAFARQRQFTADASHELRTPLTAIIGQIDVAIERPRAADSYRETLLSVREQAQRLSRLAHDLLLLARADAQLAIDAVEPIELHTLLPAIVAQVEPLSDAKDQTIEIAPTPLVVQGNEDLLIRLFLNLLDNAIRYTAPGGHISVGYASEPGQAVICIRDSGLGIAPEHLPRLFDRFYRADRGRNRAQGGSGLGLAIAQCIAQAHGGSIAVESVLGRGSTFTVCLPNYVPSKPSHTLGMQRLTESAT